MYRSRVPLYSVCIAARVEQRHASRRHDTARCRLLSLDRRSTVGVSLATTYGRDLSNEELTQQRHASSLGFAMYRKEQCWALARVLAVTVYWQS